MVDRPLHRTLVALALVVLVGLAAAGCGDDGASGGVDGGAGVDDPVVSAPADTAPTADSSPPDRPTDLSSAEVCDALPAEAVAAALGVEVEADAVEGGTPQCSYTYVDDGVTTNLVVAVMRSDADLGGRVGTDAYEHAVQRNQDVAGGVEPQPIASVGDAATYWEGDATAGMVVLAGARVVTVFGYGVTSEQAGALGGRIAASL